MTIRSFVLAGVVTLCLVRSIPAQSLNPPEPVRTKPKLEEEQPERLRQMQEDLTVFRVLFNRSTARYYNFPGGNTVTAPTFGTYSSLL